MQYEFNHAVYVELTNERANGEDSGSWQRTLNLMASNSQFSTIVRYSQSAARTHTQSHSEKGEKSGSKKSAASNIRSFRVASLTLVGSALVSSGPLFAVVALVGWLFGCTQFNNASGALSLLDVNRLLLLLLLIILARSQRSLSSNTQERRREPAATSSAQWTTREGAAEGAQCATDDSRELLLPTGRLAHWLAGWCNGY